MNRYFWTFLVAVFLVFVGNATAATLYLDPNETEIRPGDTIAVAVRLDTDTDECVNVVDGMISYSDSVTLVDVSVGNSILPFWVENPIINTNLNQVSFAGGIPNGYCGRIAGDPRLTNIVLELIFQTTNTESDQTDSKIARIDFLPQTRVLLNDGAGTLAPLTTLGGTMYVHSEPGESVVNEWSERVRNDNIPPSEFSISLNSDPSIFGGKKFIVFNTTDKQSGIDHYEVIEEPIDQLNLFRWGAADAPWVRVRSPYLLKDQSLNSTIRVKAVDKAGNEYIAVYVPDETERQTSAQQIAILLLGIFGGLTILGLLIFLFFTYRQRRQPLREDDEIVTDISTDELSDKTDRL